MLDLDFLEPQPAPPETYTIPATAFTDGEGPTVVTVVQAIGLLAVVNDPLDAGCYQVIHKPTGYRMAVGSKKDMLAALNEFMHIGVDWSTPDLGPHLEAGRAIQAKYRKK